ncbi:MAG TPA: CDP-alcohol phosphatidyltransferase family protein [Alphaproteobacteria bacterium]|nr:CDP-alcohol phosphatidyltransferase family protein [Alphaproteobacteria bacterium]
MISLPNFLSFARLLSVPVIVWLLIDRALAAAFWLFVAAGITDALDGFLAKRFNSRTELGSYLDPLADKALLVGVYVTLGWTRDLPVWLVILVVFRDFTIVGGALLEQTITQSFKSQPMMLSKVNTALQIALAALALARLGLGFDDFGVTAALVYAVAATTAASGLAYLVHFTRRLGGVETPP